MTRKASSGPGMGAAPDYFEVAVNAPDSCDTTNSESSSRHIADSIRWVRRIADTYPTMPLPAVPQELHERLIAIYASQLPARGPAE